MASLARETEEEKEFLPFHLGYLTDELIEKAKKDFGETEEVKLRGLEELKKRLDDVPNLMYNEEDNFLLPFLRVSKYNIERAYTTVLNFYNLQRRVSKMYDFNQAENEARNRKNFLGFLPYRNSNGSVIVLFRADKWEPKSVSVEEFIALGFIYVVYAIKDPATQVAGFQLLVDLKGCGIKQFSRLTPYYIKFILKSLVRCLPGRYVQFHILNQPRIFDVTWNILKLFINQHIEKRIIFHGNKIESLHQYISPRILPEEYGGTLGPFVNSTWMDIVNDKDFLMESLQYGFKY